MISKSSGSLPIPTSNGTKNDCIDFGTSPRSITQQMEFSEKVRHNSKILSSFELTWPQKPTSVMLVKRHQDLNVSQLALDLIKWLTEEKDLNVYIEKSAIDDEVLSWLDNPSSINRMTTKLPIPIEIVNKKINIINVDYEFGEHFLETIDFIITLGGDGTVLHVSSLFEEAMPPIIPFNLGSLGFLTVFDFADHKEVIENVLKGGVRLNSRMRLSCSAYSESNGHLSPIEESQNIQALNEVVIERGRSGNMSQLEVFVDGLKITTAYADGLIIATSTGSTAYSLSAGGPIMHPSVPGILITPICPHTLSFRPLLLPDSVELRIAVPKHSRVDAWASFDGRNNISIERGQSIVIKASRFPVTTACKKDPSHDMFESLSRCLNWNVRESPKPFFDSNFISSLPEEARIKRKSSKVKTREDSPSQ